MSTKKDSKNTYERIGKSIPPRTGERIKSNFALETKVTNYWKPTSRAGIICKRKNYGEKEKGKSEKTETENPQKAQNMEIQITTRSISCDF